MTTRPRPATIIEVIDPVSGLKVNITTAFHHDCGATGVPCREIHSSRILNITNIITAALTKIADFELSDFEDVGMD